MTAGSQQCPQCTGILAVPVVDAILCPHCGAINVLTGQGILAVPSMAELDLILLRPEIRNAIEQASAIRQALFGGQFTLADPTCLLDPEAHGSLASAIARANLAPWTATAWIVIDPAGRVAAHRRNPRAGEVAS